MLRGAQSDSPISPNRSREWLLARCVFPVFPALTRRLDPRPQQGSEGRDTLAHMHLSPGIYISVWRELGSKYISERHPQGWIAMVARARV